MQNIYDTFEFYKIKNEILDYSKTETGKDFINSLAMLNSKEEVKESLLDLDEIMSLISRFGPLPISSSANAIKLIDIAKKTGLLTARDLDLIANDVLTSNSILSFIKKLDLSLPRIDKYISNFFDLSSLEKEIHRVINKTGAVDDKASERLLEIRNKLRKLNNELEKKASSLALTYSQFLSDENPTMRDGHFVLPVKTSDKSRVVGAIYDVSSSGNTTFIEPLEIISLNNEITGLKVEENEEIRRLLKMLTSLVLLQEKEVINNNTIIGTLDFISAKALYAIKNNCVINEMSEEEHVELINARHPLINKERVVANSYLLTKESKIVVISGPNAGGKTVSLKTVGIFVLMNQCGLALPCDKAKISYFNHILSFFYHFFSNLIQKRYRKCIT